MPTDSEVWESHPWDTHVIESVKNGYQILKLEYTPVGDVIASWSEAEKECNRLNQENK